MPRPHHIFKTKLRNTKGKILWSVTGCSMQKFVIRFSQSTLYREMATIKYRATITHCLWSNYQINDASLKM